MHNGIFTLITYRINLIKANMEFVSAREFRSNQGRVLNAAKSGQSVVLISRYGNFKIVPISSSDEIIENKIREAAKEIKDHLEGRLDLPNAKDLVF